MSIPLKLLEEYKDKDLLISSDHEDLPLTVWNYSKNTQYIEHWDDITTLCRGLVLDDNGNIIARGFPKFFNYEQRQFDKSISTEGCRIYDKMDGSFIMLFYYDDQWIVSSKGSFHSDQVFMAQNILNKMYQEDNKFYDKLSKNLSYCFELIHPDNRIVVDYKGDERLVYLSSFDVNGVEHFDEYHKFKDRVFAYPFGGFDYDMLKYHNAHPNAEGYVIRFDNGPRCKIKFDEYIRLHSIATRTSTKDVYKSIVENSFDEVIEKSPDELYDSIKRVHHSIMVDFNTQLKNAVNIYDSLLTHGYKDDKEFSELLDTVGVSKNNKPLMYLLRTNRLNILKNLILKRCSPEFKLILNYKDDV